jgi:murein DD-endopeptidase MepM/ murein hydrolase activator NlpD
LLKFRELALKKILNILIFLIISLFTIGCLTSYAATDIEAKQKEAREQINRLKWLEQLETNKLYKNQQKLESANNNLISSKSQIVTAQRELNDLQTKLDKASAEYNALNYVLAAHIRSVYKTQRKAFFEILLNSEDINMLVDRLHYQKIVLKNDYNKMTTARNKAREIANIKYNIESRKRNLERSVASINSQQAYIQKAIAKNENMINKLRTDRAAYQKAERELAKQSASIGSYINKTASTTSSVQVASGFIKPIQGRITSPFGWRTHPIFNTRSFHSGIDIGGPNLGAIRASNSGKVIYSGWYGGYGKVVIIEHGIVNGKPITTLYAHMSSIAVSNGTKVNKGQVIGYEGTTGYSTGPHCHFEVRVNGQPNNPLNYI